MTGAEAARIRFEVTYRLRAERDRYGHRLVGEADVHVHVADAPPLLAAAQARAEDRLAMEASPEEFEEAAESLLRTLRISVAAHRVPMDAVRQGRVVDDLPTEAARREREARMRDADVSFRARQGESLREVTARLAERRGFSLSIRATGTVRGEGIEDASPATSERRRAVESYARK